MTIYEQVLELVQEGLTIQQSCNMIGIDKTFFYKQMNEYERLDIVNSKAVAKIHYNDNQHKKLNKDFIEVFRDADSFYSENTYTFKINTKSNVNKEVFQSKRV